MPETLNGLTLQTFQLFIVLFLILWVSYGTARLSVYIGLISKKFKGIAASALLIMNSWVAINFGLVF